jgi:hypothetical protein
MTSTSRDPARRPAGTRAGGQFAATPAAESPASLQGPLPDWRTQPVVIEGRRMMYADLSGGQLFHGSKARLQVGDVLEPGHDRNHRQSAPDAVSITSVDGRAGAWARETVKPGETYFVYEVEPVGRIEDWRTGPAEYGTRFNLWEGRVPGARIVAVTEHQH